MPTETTTVDGILVRQREGRLPPQKYGRWVRLLEKLKSVDDGFLEIGPVTDIEYVHQSRAIRQSAKNRKMKVFIRKGEYGMFFVSTSEPEDEYAAS